MSPQVKSLVPIGQTRKSLSPYVVIVARESRFRGRDAAKLNIAEDSMATAAQRAGNPDIATPAISPSTPGIRGDATF
jgi:hypothetical protein